MDTEQDSTINNRIERRTRRILRATAILFAGIVVLAVLTLPRNVFKLPSGLLGLVSNQTQAPHPDGFLEVKKVIDGDTIDVVREGRQQRVRLIGMDTPEVVDPRKTVQCFGREASNKAHALLDGKYVRLEFDPTQGETDKYGRLLAYVFMESGQSYNKYMIENGFAHEYTYQSQPYKYQTDYKLAEAEAQYENRGFWAAESCAGDTKKPA